MSEAKPERYVATVKQPGQEYPEGWDVSPALVSVSQAGALLLGHPETRTIVAYAPGQWERVVVRGSDG